MATNSSSIDWGKVETLVGADVVSKINKDESELNKLQIDLRNKKLNDSACKVLAPVFAKIAAKVDCLYFSGNEIGQKGIKYLSPSLAKMVDLTNLYFDNNEIGDNGCKYLAKAMSKMALMSYLKLGSNKIGFDGVKYLIKGIKKMKDAASASVFISVMAAKGKTYYGMYKKENDKTTRKVQNHLCEKLDETIQNLVKYQMNEDSSVSVDPMLADVINVIKADLQMVHYIETLKVSVGDAIALIQGKADITKETADRLGMNPAVLSAVIGTGVKKHLPIPIEKICANNGININSKTGRILYNLAKANWM